MSGVAYELQRQKRRTLTVTVTDDGRVVARAPLLLQKSAVDRFVAEKADWIRIRVAAARNRPAYAFADGESLPFAGGTLRLAVSAEARRVSHSNGVLTLPDGTRDARREAVVRFYKRAARGVFSSRVQALAAAMGVAPGPLRVSDARTRWGSCGKDDSVNLCWRLLLAPPPILDYVIVHELAHTVRRDHSKAFWAVVSRFIPDWKQKRRWLADHHMELTL